MFLIEVIPLTKISLSGPQILSYLSPQRLKRGALISVPLAKRRVKAIVHKSFSITEKKLEIKKSQFSLKTIDKLLSLEPVVNLSQLELAFFISEKYLAPLGPTMRLFLPRSLLKRQKKFNQFLSGQNLPPSKQTQKQASPLLLWKNKRLDFYLSQIEKIIKSKKTVLFLVPEISRINLCYEKLKKLSPNTQSFSAHLKTSQELKLWQDVWQGKTNIIIGTRSSVFLPFQNLGLIIVDEEENSSHKSWDQHPRYNARDVALNLAKLHKAKIILGSSLPSVESFYLKKLKKYQGRIALPKTEKEVVIIDMKNEIRWGNFSIFSEKLKKALEDHLQNKKQILLFVNRKGVATTIFCKRCGYLIKCDNCDAPMVYHRQKQAKDTLICHHCSKKKNPPSVCPNCGSTKMRYSGVGTQKVLERVRNLSKFISPNRTVKIELLDGETPEGEQKSIIKDFKKKEIDVLVSTQIILKEPGISPDLTGVILIDHILNLPDFKSAENVLQLLFKLKTLSKKLIVQTYKPEFNVFGYLKNEKFQKFFEEELKQRKKFLYPPFSEIIKLSYSHGSRTVGIRNVWQVFRKISGVIPEEQILGPAPAFISKIKNRYFWNIIIKSRKKDKENLKKLINLMSSGWTIDVDPENLL